MRCRERIRQPGAGSAAQRFCRQVFEAQLPHVGCPAGRVTVSVSVAVHAREAQANEACARLLGNADRALYGAKSAGRNQVCLG
ncbi:diguanylate cyclase [Pseudomonas sp. R5(2019)]|nr:diguanylate cyclase [Pseudomonas sp. R5(2019)]